MAQDSLMSEVIGKFKAGPLGAQNLSSKFDRRLRHFPKWYMVKS